MYRSSRWGALRLWAAAFPFHRIGEPTPLPARLSYAFHPHFRRPSSAVCANARRNESGLRFPASFSVAGCKPLTSHAMGLRRVPALHPRSPTLSGLRYAPPRQPKPTHPRNAPCVDISVGRVSRFTSRLQHTRFEKAHTENRRISAKYVLFIDYLRMHTTLTGNILSVVVHIDTQARVR